MKSKNLRVRRRSSSSRSTGSALSTAGDERDALGAALEGCWRAAAPRVAIYRILPQRRGITAVVRAVGSEQKAKT